MEHCFVNSEDDKTERSVWEKDYLLTSPGQRQLFYEYQEMCMYACNPNKVFNQVNLPKNSYRLPI